MLLPGLGSIYRAFSELATDRPATMGGLGAIPFASIDAYARRYLIEGDEFERFHHLIRAADGAWLESKRKNRKRS